MTLRDKKIHLVMLEKCTFGYLRDPVSCFLLVFIGPTVNKSLRNLLLPFTHL